MEAHNKMNILHPNFPTTLHQDVAEIVFAFFSDHPEVDSVLLLNSCARGRATVQSDLNMAILLSLDYFPAQAKYLEDSWQLFSCKNATITNFLQSSPFAKVHLDFIEGHYSPHIWNDGGGPDNFEVEIGKHIAHSFVLGLPGRRFRHLQNVWLPYYDQELRVQRLTMIRNACLYDLAHIPFFVERTLPFQAFDRLYKAFREFLQLLFIKNRQYPIAYNKWIYEQVVDWLGFDDLYPELLYILNMNNLEGRCLIEKAKTLRQLVCSWS